MAARRLSLVVVSVACSLVVLPGLLVVVVSLVVDCGLWGARA